MSTSNVDANENLGDLYSNSMCIFFCWKIVLFYLTLMEMRKIV